MVIHIGLSKSDNMSAPINQESPNYRILMIV